MSSENYLRNPSDQALYRMLAFLMGLMGLNTRYWSWYTYPPSRLYALQGILVIVFLPIAVCSMTLYLCLNYKYYEFNIVASMLSVIPFTACLTCKSLSAQTESYRIAHTDFMDKIHLYSFYIQKFPREKHLFVKNLLLGVEKTCRILFKSLAVISTICCVAWAFVPAMHNYQNNHSIHNITTRLEVGIYMWMPFDYEYNIYGYMAAQTLVTYCSFIGTIVWVVFDSVNVFYILHLTGHLYIFKYDLKMAQTEFLKDEEWERKLKSISATYSFITKSFKNIEKAYGFNVAFVYGQNLLEGGLLLYQFTNSGSDLGVILTYGLMLPIFVGSLVVLSAILENVRIQADDIPNLVYSLPWDSMSISNRKLVLSILLQVQPTLQYVAAFNIEAGVWPALTILKTTFSYYVMIKSKKEIA